VPSASAAAGGEYPAVSWDKISTEDIDSWDEATGPPTPLLDTVEYPVHLKNFNSQQLKQLCKELRSDVVHTVSQTGGHLSSSLGVVELTVAMHYVFNAPEDRMIFDVGHQCYIHKMLTGRRKHMRSIRQTNGLSGGRRAGVGRWGWGGGGGEVGAGWGGGVEEGHRGRGARWLAGARGRWALGGAVQRLLAPRRGAAACSAATGAPGWRGAPVGRRQPWRLAAPGRLRAGCGQCAAAPNAAAGVGAQMGGCSPAPPAATPPLTAPPPPRPPLPPPQTQTQASPSAARASTTPLARATAAPASARASAWRWGAT
jgi:hypothetical protein